MPWAALQSRWRLEKKRQEERDRVEAETYTKYQLDKQNILLNDDVEEIEVNGQKVQRPVGILSRQLGAAAGATNDYQSKMDAYVRQTLDGVKDPVLRGRLARRFAQDVVTTRENVIKHEVAQDKKNKINTFIY